MTAPTDGPDGGEEREPLSLEEIEATPPADGGRPLGRPVPDSEGVEAPTFKDPLAEALRLIRLAEEQGLQVRLMGGLAFHARCPEWTARIERERRDIDLATRGKDRKAVADLLVVAGYTADRQFNALFGHKQMYFLDQARGRPVDVLVDRMEMSHAFPFADRLAVDSPTLPLAELLLTKLQVARINRKDILDGLALLSEYPLGERDQGTINVPKIVALTSSDWGWWRTVTGNLDKFRLFNHTEVQPGELEFGRAPRFDVDAQVADLRAAIDRAPKSLRWKVRSQVGDSVQWFQEPEEIGH
jgi:hypothetical protein